MEKFKNMLLIKTELAHPAGATFPTVPSFKMIPVTEDCPYSDVIFYRTGTPQRLIVYSKIMVNSYDMFPKLDDDGNTMLPKKPKQNGRPYREERKQSESPYEYNIGDMDDIKTFIELFAVNSEFKYDDLLTPIPPASPIITAPEKKIILPGE